MCIPDPTSPERSAAADAEQVDGTVAAAASVANHPAAANWGKVPLKPGLVPNIARHRSLLPKAAPKQASQPLAGSQVTDAQRDDDADAISNDSGGGGAGNLFDGGNDSHTAEHDDPIEVDLAPGLQHAAASSADAGPSVAAAGAPAVPNSRDQVDAAAKCVPTLGAAARKAARTAAAAPCQLLPKLDLDFSTQNIAQHKPGALLRPAASRSVLVGSCSKIKFRPVPTPELLLHPLPVMTADELTEVGNTVIQY